MKTHLKIVISVLVASLVMTSSVLAKEDKKDPAVPYQDIENAKLVRALINQAQEDSDPVLYMAAAKLIESAGSVAIVKSAIDNEAGELNDSNIWTASALYGKAAELAGKSELGDEASKLAKETAQATNAEGCLGYNHYHYYWWYDAYGYYRYRYVYHYC